MSFSGTGASVWRFALIQNKRYEAGRVREVGFIIEVFYLIFQVQYFMEAEFSGSSGTE